MHYYDASDEVRSLSLSLSLSILQKHPTNHNASYLDRINVSNARLAGMQEDLHMSDTQCG